MIQISDKHAVRSILKSLLSFDVDRVVLSPGSRNAPFIISFDAISDFQCTSIVDERSAAFVALGMAQQLNKPVVLCCTSGSAMLNYAPAIAEAYYQNIPLIVITADRPKHWIDRGEGQSIRQMEVLTGILHQQVEWREELSNIENEVVISKAIETCANDFAPIQINVPLEEPLYNVQSWEQESQQITPEDSIELAQEYFDGLQQDWASANRILLVIAQTGYEQTLGNQLTRISEDPRVAVLTETTANVYKLDFVSCIDRTLESFLDTENEGAYIPDLIITVGENIISKRLKKFIRQHKNDVSTHIHFGKKSMNVFDIIDYHHLQYPVKMLRSLNVSSEPVSQFGSQWKEAFFKSEMKHIAFLESAPFSDLTVFAQIMDLIPDNWQLQMGNSSVVRYIQLFNQVQHISYFGNRGVSGIDGCTSTAVGAAMVSNQPVLLISGDHSFRYDSNGLAFDQLPETLKIIVINNQGGNIFRIIDGPKDQLANAEHIEHHTDKSVQKLVEYHEVSYKRADDIESLDQALIDLFDPKSDGPAVLEVFTDRLLNPEVLSNYFKNLKG
ncbi:MAG: 2-succinyl-5-enolpyruvyl-6-hydroxy-3-cyclohexene-1-carboxylic-acid synthase [Salibacteraceae bacterium]